MARRCGESILIGDEIEIVIAHIGRSRVKVGIRAPRETPVLALELRLVREENLAAAQGAVAGVSGEVAGVFEYTRLKDVMLVYATVEEAVKAMKA